LTLFQTKSFRAMVTTDLSYPSPLLRNPTTPPHQKGIHPWFCHAITLRNPLPPSKSEHYAELFPSAGPEILTSELLDVFPDPVPLDEILHTLQDNLSRTPCALLGEVGLDRAFRIPRYGGHIAPQSLPRGEDGTRLNKIEYTSLKTPIAHQVAVLEAQLDVATRLGRKIGVSVHCVQAQGAIVDVLARFKKRLGRKWDELVRVDLHSFLGSVETIGSIQKGSVVLHFLLLTESKALRRRNSPPKRLLFHIDRYRLTNSEDRRPRYCRSRRSRARGDGLGLGRRDRRAALGRDDAGIAR
jgi:Tat protein secretion system quality control protein TatD with DNase activity